jgi:hypothetical protein
LSLCSAFLWRAFAIVLGLITQLNIGFESVLHQSLAIAVTDDDFKISTHRCTQLLELASVWGQHCNILAFVNTLAN